jgi:peptidyl-tRNA hydrolase, PTH1 family
VPKLKLIAGLGNPGRTYQRTRHNLGFSVVTELAKKNGLKFKRSLLLKSLVAKGEIGGQPVVMAMPATYMNCSGIAVVRLARKFGIDLKDLLVVCDDINLELGFLRLRPSGSDGGHNGLKSIIASLASKDFPRLRLGVGQVKGKQDAADFVLSEFNKKEWAEVESQIERACDCCAVWVKEGIVKTMDKYNKG